MSSVPEAHFFNDAALKQLLRKLVEEKGQPIEFQGETWDGKPDVSSFGWVDYDAHHHVKGFVDEPGCSWSIASEATLTEVTYSLFEGSDCENRNEIGINVSPVNCACGKYRDMHLRYADSLGSVLRYLLSNDGRGISI